MSLVAFAARACLTKALLGRTVAEDRVFDSEITPFDFKDPDQQLPIILIYTDTDEIKIGGGGPYSFIRPSERGMEVVIELSLASEVQMGQVTIPHTDAGLEAALDFLERQVWREISDPAEGSWGELFRGVISATPAKIDRARGAGTEKGTRFAARQIIITTNPISEPDFEAPGAGSFWDVLLAKMRADADLSDLAEVLAEVIEGAALPSWQRIQAALGISARGMRAIGLAPFEGAEDAAGEPPIQIVATLDDQSPPPTERTISDGSTELYEVPA